MHNLYVLNSRTGKEPEPAMLRVLCNGDVAAKLAAGGLDPRPHFEIVPGGAFRVVAPEHGAWPAAMHRPTRRERLAAWARSVDWSSVFGFTVCGLFAAYLIWEALR
jgi:hypothetical protein